MSLPSFVVGFLVGTLVGLLVASLAAVAKISDLQAKLHRAKRLRVAK